jgi:hypothetical protein
MPDGDKFFLQTISISRFTGMDGSLPDISLFRAAEISYPALPRRKRVASMVAPSVPASSSKIMIASIVLTI